MKLTILILAVALLLILASAGLLWVVCGMLTLVGIPVVWSLELFEIVLVIVGIFLIYKI